MVSQILRRDPAHPKRVLKGEGELESRDLPLLKLLDDSHDEIVGFSLKRAHSRSSEDPSVSTHSPSPRRANSRSGEPDLAQARLPNKILGETLTLSFGRGVVGHSTETCRVLKHRIQDLIDSKWLEFKDVIPTITRNPLPDHGNQGINVLEWDDDMTIVVRVEDIRTPWKNIFKAMCHQGLVEMDGGSVYEDDVCIMHGMIDHTLEDCAEFRILIQKLMDSRLLVIEKNKKGSNVCVLEGVHRIQDRVITRKFVPVLNIPTGTPSYAAPPRWEPHLYMEAMVTGQPSPFPYQSDRVVPRKYQSESGAGSGQIDEVVNIAGVGNMTRSGRVYNPVDISKKIINTSKGRERGVEMKKDRPEAEQGDLFPQKIEKEVTEEEACEFLRYIKQSEYQVIDQLIRTPAKSPIGRSYSKS
ncbi:hypothetical protein Lal_00039435 [Lupinus albus]|nr:hypothetical protein Lal_00039435 [Lupinus albus]